MLQIALRGVVNNPFRYIATAIAIVLGIGFFTATSVLTTSFEQSLNGTIADAFADVDAAVRSDQTIEFSGFEIRQQIPAEAAGQIASLDNVAAAEAYLAGYAQIVTAEGKAVGDAGVQAQGLAWSEDPAFNTFSIVDGREPQAANEVVVDVETFTDGGFAIGDRVRVLPLTAEHSFTVVGTIEDANAPFPGQALAFSFEGAATVFGTTDVDQVFVAAADGVTPEELVSSLSSQLPVGLEAVTGQELVDEFQELIGMFAGIITIALQVFAGVALFVGAFVIYNTFSITVAQRTREMALLRAIGATTKQVSRTIVVESLAIGVIASMLGALAGVVIGWGLLQLLASLSGGLDMQLVIPAGALANGVVIGSVITLAAAWLPARRGAKVAPIEALRESTIETDKGSRVRAAIGLALTVLGMAASIAAVAGEQAGLLGLGLPVLVIGIVVLGPAIVRPMARVLAVPLVRGGSITGELARENASRNPKRSATTSLTLVIGVALVVAATVFAGTLGGLIDTQLETDLIADQIVEINPAIVQAGGGLDPSIAPAIAALPGVAAAVGVRTVTAEIDGAFGSVTGITTDQVAKVVRLVEVDGTVSSLGIDQVALRAGRAEGLGLGVGDTVAIRFQQQDVTLTIAGTFEEGAQLVGDWVVDNATIDAVVNRSLDGQILVATDGGDDVVAAIEAVLAGDPTASVVDRQTYIDDQAGQINQLLIVLYALLGMSVVVALIGIVNTMALSIHERTRELGLLRAVGMTTKQLRRTIRYESAIVALIGTVVGLGLGVFFGWTGSAATGWVDTVPIPWTSLAIIAVVGVLSGLAAGVLPARRAGRLNVLDAIASE